MHDITVPSYKYLIGEGILMGTENGSSIYVYTLHSY
jgi:hypothetical protein